MKNKSNMPDVGELSVSRSIRFTEREWADAANCGKSEFGGILPRHVVRLALREFLMARGYNYHKSNPVRFTHV